jgi:cell division septal protein FtsQ
MSAEELLGRLGLRRPVAPARRSGGGTRARARLRARRPRGHALLASKRARRLVLALILLVGLLGGGWLWLRDSSLVSVEHVTVTGDTGPDAAQIRTALIAAAHTMTTLDVHADRLRMAVAPYPVVRGVRISTQFPHGMRIRVIEQVPVATIVVGGGTIPVASDGTLLHDAGPTPALPVLELRAPPGGPRLTEPDAMSAVALLAAAPSAFLAKITQVSHDGVHGLTAQVRGGPVVYFGGAGQFTAKWRAVIDVLADPGSAGAAYIDVTDPQHPAAGVGTGAVAAAGLAGGGVSSSPSAATGSPAAATGTAASATGTAASATGTAAGATGTSGITTTGP